MKRFFFMLSLILIGISLAGESLSNKIAVVTSPQATNQKEDVQCKAITKSGKRCKRKKTNNSDYCKQHKLIEEKNR